MIRDTTVGMIFNFFVFVSALTVSTNNILNIINITTQDTVHFVHTIVVLCASLYLASSTINTPFDYYESNFELKESYADVLLFGTSIISACSLPIEDPGFMISKVFDSIGIFGTNNLREFIDIDANTNVTVEIIESQSAIFIANSFTDILEISIGFLVFASAVYLLQVVINKFSFASNFRETIFHRVVLVICWTSLLLNLVNNAGKDDEVAFNVIRFQLEDVLDSYVRIHYTAVTFLLTGSLYIILTYEDIGMGTPLLLFGLIQSLVLTDNLLIDETHFSFNVFLVLILFSSLVARIIDDVRQDFLQLRKDIKKNSAGTLFKIGSILTILSLLFMFFAFSFDWLDLTFKPSGISEATANAIDDAMAVIDDTIERIGEFISNLDPCIRSRDFEQPDAIQDEASLDAQLLESRKTIFNTGTDFNSQQCINPADDFNFVNLGQPQCKSLQDDYLEQRAELIESFNNNVGFKSGASSLDLDDAQATETYVDESCRAATCTTLTVTGGAAIALSFVPFAGGVATTILKFAQGGFKVFKMARRMLKRISKMRKKRKKVKAVANIIRQFSVTTSSAFNMSREMLIISMPLVLLSAASLTIIMFKRNIYRAPLDFKVKSNETNKRYIIVPLGLGYYFPLSIISAINLVFLYVVPSLIEKILTELPKAFVTATLTNGPGLLSARAAFFLGTVGGSLISLSIIIEEYKSVIDFLIAIKNAYLKFVRLIGDNVSSSRKRLQTNAEVEYGDKFKDSPLKNIYIAVVVFVNRFGNLANNAFQPILFASPSIYLMIQSFFVKNFDYITIQQGPNSDAVRGSDNISAAILTQDQVDNFDEDVSEDTGCGVVGAIAKSLLKGVLENISDVFKIFINGVKTAFDAAGGFLDKLAELIEFDFIDITLPGLIGRTTKNIFVFGLPLIGLLALVSLWVGQVFYDKLRETDKRGPDEVSLIQGVCVLVLLTQMSNVVIHIMLASVMTAVSNMNLPFIKLNTTLELDYYHTLVCSFVLILAVICLYINSFVLPIVIQK